MTPYKTILFEVRENVGYVTLNRLDKLNAQNRQMGDELIDAFTRMGTDPEVQVAILTGSGEKAFSAGADIEEYFLDEDLDQDLALRRRDSEAWQYSEVVAGFEKPTIVAINGFALGAGLELALCCDLRIASDKAKFGQPEVKIGIFPGMGGTQRLPRLIGIGRAKELIFTGRIIDTDEAYRIGLINRVVAQEDLMSEAKKLADEIKTAAPLAVQLAKTAIDEGLEMGLAQSLRHEQDLFLFIQATEDRQEGARAFKEKREPRFKGR